MEISINRENQREIVKSVTIYVENKEFRIYLNNQNRLVINKEEYGDEESAIAIRPSVSNEITLT